MSCTHPVVYTDKEGQYCFACGARLNAEAVPTVEADENQPEAEKPQETAEEPQETAEEPQETAEEPEAEEPQETAEEPEAEKPQETAKKSTKRAAKKDE